MDPAANAAYSPTACTFQPDISYDGWAAECRHAVLCARGSLWWLGDALAYGYVVWGEEKVAAAIDPADLALSEGTLRSAHWVAEKIPADHRRPELSWSHHREVAALPLPAADAWLERAVSEGWSRAELREAVQQARDQVPPPEPEERHIAEGAYDSPVFGEAARMRFGMKLGEEVEQFVKDWAERHDRALARALDGVL